jgi:hypothetical protein
MKAVVISQPMFFPWVGMLEQMRLADAYVHYDDVQFSKGSFTNRVQIKTARGTEWLTVPLRDLRLGQRIMEVTPDERKDWRATHLAMLRRAYEGAPFQGEMLALVESVYREPAATIAELAARSQLAVHGYFEFQRPAEFCWSSQMGVPGESSTRVLAVVQRLSGITYITGHGARRYLDHELFERHGVRVEYLNYRKLPYPQLHGDFTPYVSTLDLIANLGKAGRRFIASDTVYWRDFLKTHE